MDDLQTPDELFPEPEPRKRKRKSIKEAREEFTEIWRKSWRKLPIEILNLVWGLSRWPLTHAVDAMRGAMTRPRITRWVVVAVIGFLALMLPLVFGDFDPDVVQRLRDAATGWAVIGGAAVALAFQKRTSDVSEAAALFDQAKRVRTALTDAGKEVLVAAGQREGLAKFEAELGEDPDSALDQGNCEGRLKISAQFTAAQDACSVATNEVSAFSSSAKASGRYDRNLMIALITAASEAGSGLKLDEEGRGTLTHAEAWERYKKLSLTAELVVRWYASEMRR